MKTRWIATAGLLGFAVLSAAPVYGQVPVVRPPGVPSSPYSPYLNLLRPNSPAYVNYYGLVRPEVDFRSSIYGVQQGVAANAAGISSIDASTGLPLTGHATTFMNTSHYFLNRGGQGTTATATGKPVMAPGRPANPSSGAGVPAVRAPH